jgi:HAD superfamily hydrolase (TIGR01509 family)
MDLKALIFDVDGTLAETEELHRRAFNETFAAFGVNGDWPDRERQWNWDEETYARLLKTTGGKERITQYLREEAAIDPSPWKSRIAQLHRAKTARFGELLGSGELELRPGIRALIAQARQKGLKLAVATTTSRPNVEALCQACFGQKAAEVFDVIAAGDEVAAKKPAPDVYQLALERLGLSPADCVAIEDSLNGLNAAQSAGLFCIVSPSAYANQEDHGEANLLLTGFEKFGLVELAEALRLSHCRAASAAAVFHQ